VCALAPVLRLSGHVPARRPALKSSLPTSEDLGTVFPESRTNGQTGIYAFRALWAAQTISSVGTQLSLVALPLVAIIYLRAGAFEVGVLATLETLPYLIVSLPIGVLVDRLERRGLLVIADVGRAVALGAVPLCFALGLGSFPLLCLVAVVVGILTVLFTVAQQAYVPEILVPDQIVVGNQRIEISESGARVAGPSIGGAIVGMGGALLAVSCDALSYVASAVAILFGTPGAVRQPPPVQQAKRIAWRAEVGSGIRLVAGDRLLRDLMISTTVFNLGSGMVLAQVVLFATRDLGLSPAQFGLIYGLGNVGFVVGALVVGRLERWLGAGVLLIAASVLGAAALALVAAASLGFGVLALLAGRLVGALSSPLFNVPLVSLRQVVTQDEFRGRVAATFRFVDWGIAPIGALLSGIIGASVGLTPVMVVAAALGVMSASWIAVGPTRRAQISLQSAAETTDRGVSLPLAAGQG
jgi:MFS family permease